MTPSISTGRPASCAYGGHKTCARNLRRSGRGCRTMAEQPELPPIGMAFMRAVELAEALGVSKINQLDGCWTHAVDDHWWIAMNGHSDDRPASSPAGMSADVPCTVPPFSMYAER